MGREGRFIAEGTVVLRHLLEGRHFTAESILVLESRLRGIADLLVQTPAKIPVYVACRAVMDSVAGFPIHRGILAVGLRNPDQDAAVLLDGLPPAATVVVCIGIANHDNVGSIFRNAAAFGADAVLLDRTSCDPLYRKAIRVSVGAALTVPFAIFDDVDGLVRELASRDFLQLALSPGGDRDLRAIQRAPRTAIYLGTEGEGLPAALIARLMATRISLAAGFDSLNVAAASAIALHHLTAGPDPE